MGIQWVTAWKYWFEDPSPDQKCRPWLSARSDWAEKKFSMNLRTTVSKKGEPGRLPFFYDDMGLGLNDDFADGLSGRQGFQPLGCLIQGNNV